MGNRQCVPQLAAVQADKKVSRGDTDHQTLVVMSGIP